MDSAIRGIVNKLLSSILHPLDKDAVQLSIEDGMVLKNLRLDVDKINKQLNYKNSPVMLDHVIIRNLRINYDLLFNVASLEIESATIGVSPSLKNVLKHALGIKMKEEFKEGEMMCHDPQTQGVRCHACKRPYDDVRLVVNDIQSKGPVEPMKPEAPPIVINPPPLPHVPEFHRTQFHRDTCSPSEYFHHQTTAVHGTSSHVLESSIDTGHVNNDARYLSSSQRPSSSCSVTESNSKRDQRRFEKTPDMMENNQHNDDENDQYTLAKHNTPFYEHPPTTNIPYQNYAMPILESLESYYDESSVNDTSGDGKISRFQFWKDDKKQIKKKQMRKGVPSINTVSSSVRHEDKRQKKPNSNYLSETPGSSKEKCNSLSVSVPTVSNSQRSKYDFSGYEPVRDTRDDIVPFSPVSGTKILHSPLPFATMSPPGLQDIQNSPTPMNRSSFRNRVENRDVRISHDDDYEVENSVQRTSADEYQRWSPANFNSTYANDSSPIEPLYQDTGLENQTWQNTDGYLHRNSLQKQQQQLQEHSTEANYRKQPSINQEPTRTWMKKSFLTCGFNDFSCEERRRIEVSRVDDDRTVLSSACRVENSTLHGSEQTKFLYSNQFSRPKSGSVTEGDDVFASDSDASDYWKR